MYNLVKEISKCIKRKKKKVKVVSILKISVLPNDLFTQQNPSPNLNRILKCIWKNKSIKNNILEKKKMGTMSPTPIDPHSPELLCPQFHLPSDGLPLIHPCQVCT